MNDETPLVDLVPEDIPPFEEPEPKRRTTARKTTKRKFTPPYRQGVIAKGFTEIYASVGVGLMAFDPHCASVVLQNSGDMAESLEKLAKDNPAVRRALMSLISANAWSGVLIAHAPVILAITTHHVPVVKQAMESLGGKLVDGMERNLHAVPDLEPEPAA